MATLPPIKESQTRRNLRCCTVDGLFSTPWAMLSLPGSFLMAGLLNARFDVGPFWFGIIAAMPALANATNILLIPFAAKFLCVRDLTLTMGSINVGLWICGVMAIALLPMDQPATAGLFFTLLYGFTALSLSLCSVGWTAWVGDFVPETIRGRFMGQRNRVTNFSTLTFMFISLGLLSLTDASRIAYVVLASIAVAGRLVAMLVQHRIQGPDPTGGVITSAKWTRDLVSLKEEKALLRFVGFNAAVGFFMGLAGALAPLYALNELGVSPAEFTIFSIAATLSGTLCVRVWGRLIDRHGAVPVLFISFLGWRIGDVGWLLVTPDMRNWLIPVWVWGGAMATGYLLASFNLLLKLIPKRTRSAGISLNLTVTSITAAIAPIIAGTFINWTTRSAFDSVLAYKLGLGLSIVGSVAVVGLVLKIKEPKTDPALNTIPGAMRTLRQLTVNQGLGFISSLNFTPTRKSHKK